MCGGYPRTDNMAGALPSSGRFVKREVAHLEGMATREADLWYGRRKKIK